jgi:hypothetical protein
MEGPKDTTTIGHGINRSEAKEVPSRRMQSRVGRDMEEEEVAPFEGGGG